MTTTAETIDSYCPLVLVTGASGFIAKHTIIQLLQARYSVRGTIRNEEEAEIARNAVAQQHEKEQPNTSFSLVMADLTSDEGWKDAVKSCDYVIHLASPYPLKAPTQRQALTPIAKEGTVRVVQAALEEASVKRIIVTSSIVAMAYWKNRPRPIVHVTEDCWTDPEWQAVTGYPLSKTLAERAVWDLVCATKEAKDRVVVVNPSMVLGPMIDGVLSSSSEICKLMLTGSYPLLARIAYPVVDVRDVAQLLVATLTAEHIGGRRLIASADTISLQEIAQTLAETFPSYANKISTRVMPNWLQRLLAVFDRRLKFSLLDMETTIVVDSKYVTELTGVTFRPAKEAVCAMGQSLIDHHVIQK